MSLPRWPANSPIAKLMLAEDKLLRLTPEAETEAVVQRYTEFRELLWNVVESSPDPAPFTQAWNMINLYAKVDLLDFEQGNSGALARMQAKVKEAIQLLP
ncbi:hypothetical protein EXU85_20490 [Spirosoma sp. KCTC 42546]|uniref:hypothetical protein n=1 Tax=Spirosoma sp. KCTC 42546 TaxID=2520506 RepID=UPI0011590951|nr:hypothetical protein [Spirosoma sp. KCTC 42546]QDK80859.1 hypothetical protein EXU85_20490 [Spirosoma sp. KCTC 42546]